jgi:periplasmic divalent cation tolerance protein
MSTGVEEYLLVLTNLPDHDAAIELAKSLVGKRLAACVNVLDGCSSVYRWQDGIQTEREVPLLIKTHADRYPALQQAIIDLHPYELPEIVAVPFARGFQPYLQWVSTGLDLSG